MYVLSTYICIWLPVSCIELTGDIIFQDVCKMSIFYADQMCRRVIDCQREQQEEHKRRSTQLNDNNNQQQNNNSVPVPNQRRAKQEKSR